ncbi:PEP-CTERM sorting domain-containing protein [Nostoc sp. KVJ3]|uniref:PEP-CTERM sorting domain-containing protein n=1 Tax=Nostoc sp. KVJ3 TaxID=457945 RepID=UPI00223783B7|nr:PEP-CTERM sorting domain-containing protein [Nostoc sp. KVJ3]MCW5312628.1 PEP-CTERM sorting domain-containing protein [Nostoc sp. KVJ3]
MLCSLRSQFVSLMVLTGLIVPCTATIARADFARLTLDSEPGDYIGEGKTFDIYDTNLGDTISAQIRRTLSDGSPAELLWVLDRPSTPENEFALVFFGTDALGVPIQPGFYSEARRADFAPPGFAGLDISFQNRGSNEVFGSFTINEVTFTPDRSKILTFDAEFLQRSESLTAPALRGQFQFNIQAAAVPEPSSTLGLVSAGCLILYGRIRRGRGASAIADLVGCVNGV